MTPIFTPRLWVNPEWTLFLVTLLIGFGSVFLISLLSIVGIGFVGAAYSGADTQELITALAENGISETTFLVIFTAARYWILVIPILLVSWLAVRLAEEYVVKKRRENL